MIVNSDTAILRRRSGSRGDSWPEPGCSGAAGARAHGAAGARLRCVAPRLWVWLRVE